MQCSSLLLQMIYFCDKNNFKMQFFGPFIIFLMMGFLTFLYYLIVTFVSVTKLINTKAVIMNSSSTKFFLL